jgi:hypothetical protein
MPPAGEIVKASAAYGPATLNIEGDKETVAAEIARFYDRFEKTNTNGDDQQRLGKARTSAGSRTSADSPRKAKTSCAGRIELLVSADFFSKPRTAKDISDALNERATPYPANHIGAAAQQLTKRGTLRRMKGASGWAYVNP